jgi:hypothetical protein
MKIYTYSNARENFSRVLDEAREKGEIYIKRKDGTTFVVKPYRMKASPLDVSGVDLNLSKDEILQYLRESRER